MIGRIECHAVYLSVISDVLSFECSGNCNCLIVLFFADAVIYSVITIAPPVDEADVMSEKSFSSSSGKEKVNILWFRNGLRLHDNGALMKAAEDKSCKLLPLFIFDGETPTTRQVLSDNDCDVH